MKHLLVWLLLVVIPLAQARAELLAATPETVESLVGKEWRGIVYACDPYCRFLAIRESMTFNPLLTGEAVEKAHLKFIASSDPVYPYLIVMSPVYPFISPTLRNSDLVKDTREDIVVPPHARSPFSFGYSVAFGPKVSMMSVSSNTSVQSEFGPSDTNPIFTFEGALMKGSPNRIWKYWVQHAMTLALDLGGGYKNVEGLQTNTSYMELRYHPYIPFEKFKTGPRLSYLTESTKFPEDSITHFSTSQTMILFGWSALLYKRYEIFIDTAIQGAIQDSQEFRSGPFEQQFIRAGLTYCSRDVSLFGFQFGMCGGAYHKMDSQKSSLASNVTVTDQSSFDRTETTIKFLIRIGEDFFR